MNLNPARCPPSSPTHPETTNVYSEREERGGPGSDKEALKLQGSLCLVFQGDFGLSGTLHPPLLPVGSPLSHYWTTLSLSRVLLSFLLALPLWSMGGSPGLLSQTPNASDCEASLGFICLKGVHFSSSGHCWTPSQLLGGMDGATPGSDLCFHVRVINVFTKPGSEGITHL